MARGQLGKESKHPSSLDLPLEKTSLKRPESTEPTPAPVAQKEKDKSNDTPPLMLQVRQGNRKAFESLCHKYTPAIGAYFRRYIQCMATIDDLTQEVFTDVWHKREDYRSGTPDLPYLRGFAEYALKSHQRKNVRKLNVSPEYDLSSIIDAFLASPLDQTDVQEQIQTLRDLLTHLPERQQQALELTRVKGLSIKEASEKMSCSDKTVRCYRSRGLAQLKAWLKN